MAREHDPGTMVLLTRLSRLVHRRSTEELLGIRLKQYIALGQLRDADGLRQQDLCAAMMLDPNNCVLLLNDLEAAGYLERRRDPEDRRRHLVAITPAGVQAVARAEQAIETLEDEVLTGLSPEERAHLRKLLAQAAGALS